MGKRRSLSTFYKHQRLYPEKNPGRLCSCNVCSNLPHSERWQLRSVANQHELANPLQQLYAPQALEVAPQVLVVGVEEAELQDPDEANDQPHIEMENGNFLDDFEAPAVNEEPAAVQGIAVNEDVADPGPNLDEEDEERDIESNAETSSDDGGEVLVQDLSSDDGEGDEGDEFQDVDVNFMNQIEAVAAVPDLGMGFPNDENPEAVDHDQADMLIDGEGEDGDIGDVVEDVNDGEGEDGDIGDVVDDVNHAAGEAQVVGNFLAGIIPEIRVPANLNDQERWRLNQLKARVNLSLRAIEEGIARPGMNSILAAAHDLYSPEPDHVAVQNGIGQPAAGAARPRRPHTIQQHTGTHLCIALTNHTHEYKI